MPFVHAGLLGIVLLFLIAMLEVGIIQSAYQKLGMSNRAVTLLLLLSIFGSYINIPVAAISSPPVVHHHHIYYLSYAPTLLPIPGETIVAVNIGGALIPVLLSSYLLMRIGGVAPAFIATVVAALIVHHFAQIIPGAGITVPTFIPGIAAAVLAILLTSERRPVVAYVAGTIGCLVGADLLNLARVARLSPPIMSIGGAGTFDGVFVSGVIAVLLA